MKKKNLKIVLFSLFVVIGLSACLVSEEKNSNNTGSVIQNDEAFNSENITVSEDYFEWEDNYITGLTEEGKNQTYLVIPKRCEGFLAKILSGENSVEHVSFESDKDIDLNRGLSLATNLKTVKLPENLDEVGSLEFWDSTNLESITIPANVTAIGDRAFLDCESLKTVVFEGEIVSIEECAFQNCVSLTEITLPNMITSIEKYTFQNCKSLTEITIPDTVTTIGEYAFYGCENIKTITIPDSVTTIGAYACAETGITDIYLSELLEFTEWKTSSFVINKDAITVHLVEGSWSDLHFSEIFVGAFEKQYDMNE